MSGSDFMQIYCNIVASVFVLNRETFHDSCYFLLSNAGVRFFDT